MANIYYNQPMLADMAATFHVPAHKIGYVATATQIGYAAGMPLFIPAGQLYYWSFAWQGAERKAMEDLRAGRARTFVDAGAAVRYLLGSDR